MLVPDNLVTFVQEWATPLAGFGSLALSFALVILYRQQQQLLKRSYDANHRAVVDIESYEVHNREISLYLSNVGNGVATDLELVTATVFKPTDALHPGVTTAQLSLQLEQGGRGRQSLKAGEDHLEFTTRPALGFKSNGQTSRNSIESAMVNQAVQEEINILRIHYFLRYSDLRDHRSLRYIAGWEVEPDKEIDVLETLVSQGGPMMFGEPRIDPESLELDLSGAVTEEKRTVV